MTTAPGGQRSCYATVCEFVSLTLSCAMTVRSLLCEDVVYVSLTVGGIA